MLASLAKGQVFKKCIKWCVMQVIQKFLTVFYVMLYFKATWKHFISNVDAFYAHENSC